MNPQSSSIDKKNYAPVSQQEDAPPPAYDSSTSNAQPSESLSLNQLLARTDSIVTNALQATPQMTILGGNRNPTNLQVGLDGKREWNHTLCSCHEAPGTTLNALCCPCIVYSSNKSRLMHLQKSGQPIPSPQYVGLWCGLYALSPQFLGIGQVAMQCFSRLQTRNRYNIRGDVVQDTLVGAFCVPCSLVQESREIEEEEMALRREILGEAEGEEGLGGRYRDEEERA